MSITMPAGLLRRNFLLICLLSAGDVGAGKIFCAQLAQNSPEKRTACTMKKWLDTQCTDEPMTFVEKIPSPALCNPSLQRKRNLPRNTRKSQRNITWQEI
ncbi:MAG: hypothetical protein ONB48_14705 [candidate division KSB1 bacterium]|nr:hypothetical protein [candidate division KSB1 bacterium]MDZ7273513.1 hypothetical protein [candidate division KSB1 bacterium]MDZ7286896.1 hypothetical protein [candidate division KSB1 bacterium]MDZ7299751.1 hypothetical protein [candidate division KSB1 bacterium]MDZ7305690.1 hypothetical protein [candidate division KSB1 bacterium]